MHSLLAFKPFGFASSQTSSQRHQLHLASTRSRAAGIARVVGIAACLASLTTWSTVARADDTDTGNADDATGAMSTANATDVANASAEERPSTNEPVPAGSVRAVLGLGAGSNGVAFRVGGEGEAWITPNFGIGGRIVGGQDSKLWDGYTDRISAQPTVNLRTGSERVSWILSFGLGPGSYRRHVVDERGGICWSSVNCAPEKSHDETGWTVETSLSGRVVGYLGPVALSAGVTGDMSTSAGTSVVAFAGIGIAPGRF